MTGEKVSESKTPRTVEELERELAIQKRITQAAINSNAHWDDVSEFLVWERPQDQYEESISAEHTASALATFPQFADDIRSFVENWNKAPRFTDAMLAEIEFTPADEVRAEATGRMAVRMMNFYTKLRKIETELAAANAKLEAPKVSAGKRCEAGHDGYWTTLYGNCMACRSEAAERRLADARAAVIEETILVPRNLTLEMREAGGEAYLRSREMEGKGMNPMDMAEGIYCEMLRAHDLAPYESAASGCEIVDQLRAVKASGAHGAADPSEWLIYFDDADRRPELFSGKGAATAANRRYVELCNNWSVHLFSRPSLPLRTHKEMQTVIGN